MQLYRLLSWPLLLAAALSAGCLKSESPRFRLNKVQMVAANIPVTNAANSNNSDAPQGATQQDIETILVALFGTPDQPVAFPETGLDSHKLKIAAGPTGYDQSGQEIGLFRRHCVHCHGITGDGVGPTAAFLNPYPRDYRQGKFKFKSTESSARPTHADLRRILEDGVPGTSMPSFKLLPGYQLDALVEYVKYLSIRGEMELWLIDTVLNELGEGEKIPTDRGYLIDELLVPNIVDRWQMAEEQVIRPNPETAPRETRTPEQIAASVDAGRKLFYGEIANCIKCHGDSALGDGQTNDYDDWNKAIEEFKLSHESINPVDLGALPVRHIKPRNLRQGIYRGGRRPLDLYRRMHAGIYGTPMPGLGSQLTPEEIWQLVDYVRSLPYEPGSLPPQPKPMLSRERL